VGISPGSPEWDPIFEQLQTNCMSKLSKRHFWEWFKRNNKEYLELNNKSKKEAAYWLAEMNTHLRAYFKFFEYSLALPDKGDAKLTISVNGKTIHFKKVESFVATAPEIPGWNIIALEEPMPIDFILEKQMANAGIEPGEFSFSFVSDDADAAHIMIYHPLCTPANERHFLELAYGAVYNLLGERSFGIDISLLEMANMSDANVDEVYPLEELPIHIGSRKSSIVVDQNGSLLDIQ
jgi:hypothetical protein